LKVLEKEGISFTCFINYILRESSILQGTYFILVESMQAKYKEGFVCNFNYGVWMNTFYPTVCCIYLCSWTDIV